MKRAYLYSFLIIAAIVLLAGNAEAGVLGRVRSWIGAEAGALAFSTVLAAAADAMGIMFRRVSQTLREAGEFLSTLGAAIEDRKLTREELVNIIREGRDIFAVWH